MQKCRGVQTRWKMDGGRVVLKCCLVKDHLQAHYDFEEKKTFVSPRRRKRSVTARTT